ncbi:glyoxalase [Gordonia sp. HY285]|uniref:VOC family protein n=1 Tax=Gordonia liuliyuniae TaxID=2911517 RepID=UPI001F25987C|nr:VOC family protein [Gordonia liuliyuniae]MCF8608554.1 glyoxalase [Gordonia liuliyuniae]
MHKMIFVNLPVADLDASRAFFTSMGYEFNDNFCDGDALALVLGDSIVAMLLQRDVYKSFVLGKEVVDAHAASGCIVCLSAESRDEVDAVVDKAMAAGATAGDTEEHGFMYGRSFFDLDGHAWEIMWMDPAAAEVGPQAYAAQQG